MNHRRLKFLRTLLLQVSEKHTINRSLDLMLFHVGHFSTARFIPRCSPIFVSAEVSLMRLPTHVFSRIQYFVHVTGTSSVTVTDMKSFLKSHGYSVETGHTCLFVNCPICMCKSQDQHGIGRMSINKTTGTFLCGKCEHTGPWEILRDYIVALRSRSKIPVTTQCIPRAPVGDMERQQLQDYLQSCTHFSKLSDTMQSTTLQSVVVKNIIPETLLHFDCHLSEDEKSLIFPVYGYGDTLQGLRRISLKNGSLVEENVNSIEDWGIFGWMQVVAKNKELVFTGSIRDALAVSQSTSQPVMAISAGSHHLPQEVLPLFEQFKKITVWFGSDTQTWDAAKIIAKKLHEKRCSLVRILDSQPNPHTALDKQMKLSQLIKDAEPLAHKSITTFDALRKDVYSELANINEVMGIKWKKYPALSKVLRGHRCGELTVFTGPTGSGKTTFLSDYSLDLCVQGVSTLWGSFEISNIRLAKMMMQQFAGMSLEKNIDQFDYWADKFEKLPLYFMTFYGQESLKNILDAMTHSVYMYDIAHVVIDNLQFMMGVSDTARYMDRFWKQDTIIAAMRKFATVNNCHVTLVIHPRKERDTDELQTSSIFGGAKASQEADNILILQVKQGPSSAKKYLQVAKNRFSGDLGVFALEFDRNSLSFAPKKKPKKKKDQQPNSENDDSPNSPAPTGSWLSQ